MGCGPQGKARTKDGKGVTIPSQTRFVKYYGKFMQRTITSAFVSTTSPPCQRYTTLPTPCDVLYISSANA